MKKNIWVVMAIVLLLTAVLTGTLSLIHILLYLFVHSVLHLLGFDHEQEEEKAQMRLLEEAFLKEAGCPA